MTLSKNVFRTALASLVIVGLTACGGGNSDSETDPIGGQTPTPPPAVTPTPTATAPPLVDFNQTVLELATPQGSVTLYDGRTYDGESTPIEISDYTWEIDNSDVDESELDDVFSE